MKKLIILLLFAASCTSLPGRLDPPEGFVRLEQYDYDLMATAADGSKIFVSRETGQPEADGAFWKEAVERELTGRGYEVVPTGASQTIRGPRLEGEVLEFGASLEGVAYRYVVAVFVDGATVHTIEFICEEPQYERHRKAVGDFIRSYAGAP